MIKLLPLRQSIFLACLLVMMTSTAAENFLYHGLRYVVTGSNTVAVAPSLDAPYSGEIVIPGSVTGGDGITYTVTAVGENAFANCNDLTSVVVPNSVTAIGQKAFYQCLFLSHVELPETVSTIGNAAFAACQSLKDISIPSAMSAIQDSTFNGCSSLTAVSIPHSVTAIGTGRSLRAGGLRALSWLTR